MKYCIILILNLAFAATSISQTTRGIVKDTANSPIEMASVIVKSKLAGTATNSDGLFQLDRLIPGDTIVVSHLSYINQKIVLGIDSVIEVTLLPSTTWISEIVASNLSPKQLVEKAISQLANNHYDRSNYLDGFIRESYFRSDTLRSLTEATLKINLPSKPGKAGAVSVVKKRTFLDEKMKAQVTNSPLVILNMDEAHARSSILNSIGLRNHTFTLEGYQTDDNSTYYKVGFKPKRKTGHRYYEGHLLINAEDFSFKHIDVKNTSPTNTTWIKTNYAKVNGKYLIANLQIEKNKTNSKVNVSYVTTQFKAPKRNKRDVFEKGETLRLYGNHYNTDYWNGYQHVLPDTTLLKQSAHLTLDNTPIGRSKSIKPLYQPNLALFISTQSIDDIEALNKNINALSTLTSYAMANHIKKDSYASMAQVAFTSWVTLPFHGAEAERRILSHKGYNCTYQPFIFNGFYNSYCKDLSNNDLTTFKDDNISDFLRLHTVRYESNFNTIKKIEEELFRTDFLHRDRVNEFLDVYFINYLIRRLYLSAPFFFAEADIEFPQKEELEMPLSTNRLKSYVKYLHQPNAPFERTITSEDLSPSEQSYLSTMKWLSSVNFMIGITNLLPPININKYTQLRLSGGYLPSPFGHQLEQNIYLIHNKQISVINFRQYLAKHTTGFGAGFKVKEQPVFKNITLSTQIDYWQQPKNISFYDTKLTDGFAVKQEFSIGSKAYRVLLGYIFKTNGFIDYATSLNKSANVHIGFKYHFNHN